MPVILHRSVKPDTLAQLEIRGEHVHTTQEVYVEKKTDLAIKVMHANGWTRYLHTTSVDAGVYTDRTAPGTVTFRLLPEPETAAVA